MNILYISYWNLNDPLTYSTVFPNLKILSSFSWVSRIIFVNIERESGETYQLPFSENKVSYKPFISNTHQNVLIEKAYDFIKAPAFIRQLIKEYKIDALLARGALAGGLAYLVWRKTKIPFYVESFEPHGRYMVDTKVWRHYDPRTLIENYLEQMQKKYASGLMPVAFTYDNKLEKSGIDKQKIKTVPCLVDVKRFAFSDDARKIIRDQLGIPESSIVGIYAGRYGGLYLEEEAFHLYQQAFTFFGNDFHLILLTPVLYHDWIRQQLAKHTSPSDHIHILSISHDQVPGYLSVSDFAFATYKVGKSMAYLSPVKIGEYWANGLPVVLTKGVGDETQLIRKYPYAGVLFKPPITEERASEMFSHLRSLISSNRNSDKLPDLAKTKRSPDFVVQAYEYFLKPLSEK